MTRNFSIVVPTYNRRDILLKTLEAYKNQTAVDGILELIVIDDGSTDGTREAVPKSSLSSPFPIHYLRQEHKGPARGRNYAIRESKGEFVLLGDDDIIPTPSLVAEHLAWHEEYPAPSDAVLGYVAWAREISPTPFMEWLAHDGIIFGYGSMRSGQVKGTHFYSCNLSMKRDFMLQNGMFDEEFPAAAFEDIELGYRLTQKGLRLFYNPKAVGYHCKKMSLADVWRRAEMVEKLNPLFLAKTTTDQNPNPFEKLSAMRKARRAVVRAVLPVLSPVLRLFDTQVPLPWVVYRTFYSHYILPKVRTKLGIVTQ